MDIGNAICDARRKKGLKRQDLAAMLGVATSTVGDWENGQNRVAIQKIPAIAAALGLSKDAMLKLNGICPKVGSNKGCVRKSEAAIAKLTPRARMLCGDCAEWLAKKKRVDTYRLGHCRALDITTERCDWCRRGKV